MNKIILVKDKIGTCVGEHKKLFTILGVLTGICLVIWIINKIIQTKILTKTYYDLKMDDDFYDDEIEYDKSDFAEL